MTTPAVGGSDMPPDVAQAEQAEQLGQGLWPGDSGTLSFASRRALARLLTGPLVHGIESSCDETGIGIVKGTTLLADAVASSVDEQVRFGGVVPEVASRAHVEAMVPTLQRALAYRQTME